jgi:predicted kinase
VEAIILIGIQGSGKSSFYRQRFFDTHVRLNLDMLKTPRRERILLDACITAGLKFVADNTNATSKDRAKYISVAKPAGFRIIGYYFQSELKDALKRNRQRTGRAVIPVPGVIATLKRMQIPSKAEGFDELYSVRLNDQNEFVIEELTEVH